MFARVSVLLPFVLFVSAVVADCPAGHHRTCCASTLQGTSDDVKQVLQNIGRGDLVSGVQGDQTDALTGIDCHNIDGPAACTQKALCCTQDLTGRDGQQMSIHCSLAQ